MFQGRPYFNKKRKINFCRICLETNIRMLKILGSDVQDVFENVTNKKIQEDGDIFACYLCYHQLRKCKQLVMKAQTAEELLRHVSTNGESINITQNRHGLQNSLRSTSIEIFHIMESNITMNMETENQADKDCNSVANVLDDTSNSSEVTCCRLCLRTRLHLRLILGAAQRVYEQITNQVTEATPACYLCHRQLQTWLQLASTWRRAEELLQRVLEKGYQLNENTISMEDRRDFGLLSTIAVSRIESWHTLDQNEIVLAEAYIKREENRAAAEAPGCVDAKIPEVNTIRDCFEKISHSKAMYKSNKAILLEKSITKVKSRLANRLSNHDLQKSKIYRNTRFKILKPVLRGPSQRLFMSPATCLDDHSYARRINRSIRLLVLDIQTYTTMKRKGFKLKLNPCGLKWVSGKTLKQNSLKSKFFLKRDSLKSKKSWKQNSLKSAKCLKQKSLKSKKSLKRKRLKLKKRCPKQLMPMIYDNFQAKIELLSKVDWITITTHILWSNTSLKTCGLLSFTAHAIVKQRRLKIGLGASVLDDHNNIASRLKDIAKKYKIERKIHMVLRDNGYIVGDKIDTLDCVAHSLKMTVNEAIFSVPEIALMIEKCRRTVEHFQKGEARLLQEELHLPVQKLYRDVEACWNSTLLMLESLTKQEDAIKLYRIEKSIEITIEEWRTLNAIVKVLKYLFQATLDISLESACVSMIIPLIATLKEKLRPRDNFCSSYLDDAEAIKAKLLISLNKNFSHVKNNSALITATLLDPRFKTKYLTDAEVNLAKINIMNTLNGSVENPLISAANDFELCAGNNAVEFKDDATDHNTNTLEITQNHIGSSTPDSILTTNDFELCEALNTVEIKDNLTSHNVKILTISQNPQNASVSVTNHFESCEGNHTVEFKDDATGRNKKTLETENTCSRSESASISVTNDFQSCEVDNTVEFKDDQNDTMAGHNLEIVKNHFSTSECASISAIHYFESCEDNNTVELNDPTGHIINTLEIAENTTKGFDSCDVDNTVEFQDDSTGHNANTLGITENTHGTSESASISATIDFQPWEVNNTVEFKDDRTGNNINTSKIAENSGGTSESASISSTIDFESCEANNTVESNDDLMTAHSALEIGLHIPNSSISATNHFELFQANTFEFKNNLMTANNVLEIAQNPRDGSESAPTSATIDFEFCDANNTLEFDSTGHNDNTLEIAQNTKYDSMSATNDFEPCQANTVKFDSTGHNPNTLEIVKKTKNDSISAKTDFEPCQATTVEFNEPTHKAIVEALDNYLKEPRLNRNANIFKYWCSSHQILRKAAIKNLSAPPTNVISISAHISAELGLPNDP